MPNRPSATSPTAGLLTPAEVMARLRVSRNTLLRWEEADQLAVVKLPSGHRRYRAADVEAIERGEVPA